MLSAESLKGGVVLRIVTHHLDVIRELVVVQEQRDRVVKGHTVASRIRRAIHSATLTVTAFPSAL